MSMSAFPIDMNYEEGEHYPVENASGRGMPPAMRDQLPPGHLSPYSQGGQNPGLSGIFNDSVNVVKSANMATWLLMGCAFLGGYFLRWKQNG